MPQHFELVPCENCRSDKFSTIRDSVDGSKIVRCLGCGLEFVNPLPTEEWLKQLYAQELQRRMEAQTKLEATKMKIEWGSQIRSYVMQPYKLVKDNRTDFETSNVQAVMDGNIDGFIKAFLMEFSDSQKE